MGNEATPTKAQLVEELSKFTRRGLGRSLPGGRSESTVRGLAEISRELADEPSEDWPLRIARIVIREVEAIEPPEDRLAIADVLAVDLERPLEEILAASGPVEPLESSGAQLGRYTRAADRYTPPMTERHFKERRRIALLERVSERLLERLKERREEAAESEPVSPVVSGESTTPLETKRRIESPTLLVGIVGVLLMLVGAAWLVAAATGAIS